jgi:hypothetical protein
MMNRKRWWAGLAVALLFAGSVGARSHDHPSTFTYAGGTEEVKQDCQGKLEVTSTALTFTCAEGSVTAPYDQIKHMEYRSSLSKQVRRMKLHWKVRPEGGGKRNRYLTVIYGEGGEVHAFVLTAPLEVMRPYLAEIDLKSGQRVEVERNEGYY